MKQINKKFHLYLSSVIVQIIIFEFILNVLIILIITPDRICTLNYCTNCLNYKVTKKFSKSKRRCSCGSYFFQLGPMYSEEIYDKDFVKT